VERNTLPANCLWPLNVALAHTGIGRSMFIAACRDGQIPVELLALGERGLLFVRAAELRTWLAGSTRPMETSNG
jgi:hypothetical protein